MADLRRTNSTNDGELNGDIPRMRSSLKRLSSSTLGLMGPSSSSTPYSTNNSSAALLEVAKRRLRSATNSPVRVGPGTLLPAVTKVTRTPVSSGRNSPTPSAIANFVRKNARSRSDLSHAPLHLRGNHPNRVNSPVYRSPRPTHNMLSTSSTNLLTFGNKL